MDPQTAQPDTDDPMIGGVLDHKYRIESWLADGGMATIYRGSLVLLDRPLAVKVMHSSLRRHIESRYRFERELQMSRMVAHPNVVKVHDGGVTEDGHPYLVMEYLEGETLDHQVAEQGLDIHYAIELFVQLCDGVEAIHKSGLLHRDLKPSNVFLCHGRKTRFTSGVRVKVLDFGLVRQADDRAATSLTKEHAILGTAGYLAPEQIDSDRPPDQRADIYALGGVLAFMLTGVSPFAASSARATIGRQLHGGPSKQMLERLPKIPALHDLVKQALARQPFIRFANVAAMREAVLDLPLPGSGHVAEVTPARPGKPRESEFATAAVPFDEFEDADHVVEDYPAPLRLMANSVLDVLRGAGGPLSTAEIRDRLRHETTLDIDAYVRVLETLADDHVVIAGAGSWRIARSTY